MLETFTLKQHLDTTRQELAQALYQHDAACRVIARLMQERDEARHMLNHMQMQGGVVLPSAATGASNGHQDSAMAVDAAAAPAAAQLEASVAAELEATCATLSAERKARKSAAPSALAPTVDSMKSLAVQASHTPHKADSKTGITCVAVSSSFPSNSSKGGEAEGSTVILSGSTDKNVILTQMDSGKVVTKLTGHSKKVTAVAFRGIGTASVFSASADNTVKVMFLFLHLFLPTCENSVEKGSFNVMLRGFALFWFDQFVS
jgi:pre-mRNA-processing factor 19